MAAAAQPAPDPASTGEILRAQERETLRKIRSKTKNGSVLNPGSSLFRVRAALNEDEDVVVDKIGSSVHKIPDPIPD